MPPKKPAADSAEPPAQSSSDAPVEDKKTDAAALRKVAAHPSTAIMVKEALKELDSRKGVSSQAIQNYIKQKYPSVDLVRLKHLVRRALKKGLETGTLVRPANSTVTTGATGKFRLPPKVKETKSKTENTDPNVQKQPKAATKKPKKAGAAKKKDTANEEDKSQEDPKPAKKSKKNEEDAPPKAVPAKKPKAKKAVEKGESDGDKAPAPAKTKAAKTTKEAKAGKASQSKTAKESGDVPATKAKGKRGKKAAE
ncbi:linker histone H1M [Larimichthys crocea]|uniref:linker histone H1M n=1 Tax=Larimichthys crocea TaxID=215358 RepID=UPI000F5DBF66|nr:protein B4 [Larimichthys crocea]